MFFNPLAITTRHAINSLLEPKEFLAAVKSALGLTAAEGGQRESISEVDSEAGVRSRGAQLPHVSPAPS